MWRYEVMYFYAVELYVYLLPDLSFDKKWN